MNNFFICDTETGGLDPKKHPITQICIHIVDPIKFSLLHSYDTFVKPYNNLEISPKALQVSQVTMSQINKGVDANTLMKGMINTFKIANKTGKAKPIFVGHNSPFDLGFLEYFFKYMNQDLYKYLNKTWFDTLSLCKLFEGDSLKANENVKFNLTACCDRMGIVLHNAHGASADVEATKLLFKKLTGYLRNGNNKNLDMKGTNNTIEKARDNFFFEF